VSADDLPGLLFRHGRILVLGPSGAGKSTALKRLHALDAGWASQLYSIPAILDKLRESDSPLGFRRWLTDSTQRSPGTRMLLCLDGLDEVPVATAQEVLDAVEAVSRKDPQLAVVVTDRVARRAIQSDRWAYFGIASRGGAPLNAWTTLPFFHDRRNADATRSEAIRHATRSISTELVAEPAYVWLEERDSTAASSEAATRMLGVDIVEQLRRANLLVDNNNATHFKHPLIHAFFAIEHVRERPELWRDETWDALTLEGGNFSSLGLLLEQVADEQVDQVVRSVNRWNYLACGSLLAEDFAGARRTGTGLRNALLLLLGHRRFSPSVTTSLLSADQLRLQVDDDIARRILETENRDQLEDVARELPADDEWWRAWLSTFVGRASEAQIGALEGDDHVLAWTAANIMSAHEADAETDEHLIGILRDSSDSDLRWRAIHALSSSRSIAVADHCINIFLAEGDEWVRYGALRAFLQVAARLEDPDERQRVCSLLAESVDVIRENPRWEREIERAVQLETAPEDWATTFGVVIGALWAASTRLEEEDRWRVAASILRIDDDDLSAATIRPMPEEGRE
jgi:hypothetical protein